MDSEISHLLNKIHGFCTFGSILGLSRMEELTEKLSRPQDKLKVIHIAGTNGKGSVCRYMYECLMVMGYSVGMFTSPYITVFNERIEIDGKCISDSDLIKYGEEVLKAAEDMQEPPTEFELITAIAMKYFSEKDTDYVILEVGLGGRGDSTNVVNEPLISVITSIGFDHMDRLGDTLKKIAYEKAGIIKDTVPVISAVIPKEAKDEIKRIAVEMNSEFIDVSDLKHDVLFQDKSESRYLIDDLQIKIQMAGSHQVMNSIAAYKTLMKLKELGKLEISEDAIKIGMGKAKQPGRFEVLGENEEIVIDGAHNVDGIITLRETLIQNFKGRKILLVVGILQDKAYNEMVSELVKITDEFIVTEPDNPRKLNAIKLSEEIEKQGAKCLIEPIPREAFERAMEIKGNYDVIVFAGSLYLVSEIRGLLIKE